MRIHASRGGSFGLRGSGLVLGASEVWKGELVFKGERVNRGKCVRLWYEWKPDNEDERGDELDGNGHAPALREPRGGFPVRNSISDPGKCSVVSQIEESNHSPEGRSQAADHADMIHHNKPTSPLGWSNLTIETSIRNSQIRYKNTTDL